MIRKLIFVLLTLPATGLAASPSFDCTKARSSAEELICADDALAQLDTRMAQTYAQALSAAMDDADTLRASQRGWIKGRDDCWKADDLRTCVRDAYLLREADLVARWMLQAPLAVTAYICDGNPANEVTAYFYDTELPGVRLEYGDSIRTGALVPTGSGSKYMTEWGGFIWIQGRDAQFSWVEGTQMSCVATD